MYRLIFLVTILVAITQQKSCYSGTSPLSTTCIDPRKIVTTNVTQGINCLSSEYTCNSNDVLGFCTQTEIMNTETIMVFTYVKDCQLYTNGSISNFKNAKCCNDTDNCNVELGLCDVMKCYSGNITVLAGCVDPLLISSVDLLVSGNNSFCISYAINCSDPASNDSCTQDEINAQSVKYIMTHGDQMECDEISSLYNSSSNNVTCCSTPNCNAPSQGVCTSIECYNGFSDMKCLDESSLLKNMYKTGDYVCASYIFNCTSDNATICTQAEINKKAQKYAFTAINPTDCDALKTNSMVQNVSCCTTNLCNNVSLSCSGRQCYAGVTIEDNSTGCIDLTGLYGIRQNETLKCISYKYKCLLNDSACTPREISLGVFKWRFSLSTLDFCANLVKNPTATNVSCCDGNFCNLPKTGFCNTSQLSCFDGVVAAGKDNCANESEITQKNIQSGATQCISYLDPTTNMWTFTSGNDFNCSQLQGPLKASNVTCCAVNNCNYPWFGYCTNSTGATGTGTATTGATTMTMTMTNTASPSNTTSTPSNTQTPSATTGKETTSEGTVKYLSLIPLILSYLFI